MVAVPPATPVTTPEPDPTVAIAVLPELHTPPSDALLNVVVDAEQTVNVPKTGELVTVNVLVALLLQPVAYVMVAVPLATAVTIPDVDPTVAVDVFPLLHMP
jgi:hypothetical protein